MRMSQYFLPVHRETPKEAEIVSHQLMLRAGMIRQESAGIYSWLPLGLTVMRRIEQIVREEQNRAGFVEMLMPTIQSAELWRASGRYDDYGKEMLRIRDRHDREMLYGPTNEEMVTDIIKSTVQSYRDLPKLIYHVQWKFRDERRPRFGVMRGREFLMKDAYSIDIDAGAARRSYYRQIVAYLRIFARMGMKAIPMAADSGQIGGDLSHEFVILAETGESAVYCDRKLLDLPPPDDGVDYEADLSAMVAPWMTLYAATEERHDPDKFVADVPPERQVHARGIEVGHIFYFGTKYSEAMAAMVQDRDGVPQPVEMGSYGVGISRLVAGIIEASHDDRGIIWPEAVAPFRVGLINVKADDEASRSVCEKIYAGLSAQGIDVLYDDSDERPGAKFSKMDLIGLPWQIIVGPRTLREGRVEVKHRATDQRELLTTEEALAKFSA